MVGVLLAVEGSLVASGVVMSLLCAGIGYWIGEKKGRGVIGAVLGLILGIIGLVIILLIPAKHDDSVGGFAPPPAPS